MTTHHHCTTSRASAGPWHPAEWTGGDARVDAAVTAARAPRARRVHTHNAARARMRGNTPLRRPAMKLALCVAVAACAAMAGLLGALDGADAYRRRGGRQSQASNKPDPYESLGVPKNADAALIKRHYRRLSLKFHPDKQTDKSDKEREAAAAKFIEITEAYEILSDDDKRRIFDQHGHAGLENNAGGGGGGSPFDMFGRRRQPQDDGPPRAPDTRVPLRVTLEQLYTGATIPFSMKKQMLCPECHGTGAHGENGVRTCSTCGGSGKTYTRHRQGPFIQQVEHVCSACGGTGKTIVHECHECHGAGTVQGEMEQDVYVDPGMLPGAEIRMSGTGDEHADKEPGDLVFVVRELKHPVFSRTSRGSADLSMTLTLTLREALLGFKRQITHLDGHKVPIARSGVTRPGHVVTVRGEGMPLHDQDSERGQLRVQFAVELPTDLSSAQTKGIADVLRPGRG